LSISAGVSWSVTLNTNFLKHENRSILSSSLF